VADGAGASAIAEGAGATAVAEGRAAHAVAEGPGAHAVAEGAGSRAIAEDGAKAGHADRVLEGRPLEAGGRGQELPLKGEVKQIYAKELLVGHEYRD
jgi:hypothetical protein